MAPKEDLGQQIQRMRESSENFNKFLKEQRENNKKYAQISNIMTLLIVLIIVIFIFSFYNTIKSNFAPDKFVKSLEKHAPDVAQPVAEKAVEVVTDVYPVYYELAVKETVETLPQWSQLADEQIQKLSTETTEQATEQLKGSLSNAIKHQESPLRKAFPNLTDEDAHKLIEELATDLEKDLTEVSEHIVNGSVLQLLDLHKSIQQFNTKGLPDNEGELSRLIIHHVLQLVDIEVMKKEGGAKVVQPRKK